MATKTPLEAYSIRNATEADLPVILDIYNEQIKHSTALFMFDCVDLTNRQHWLKDCQEKGYPVIVAVENSTLQTVAYASYGEFRNKPAFVVSAEISLYIHKGHQRKGLGKVMLDEMIRIADAMQLRSVIAAITSENEASQKLFTSRGFTLAGTFHNVGYKFGKYLNVDFFERISTAEYHFVDLPSVKPFPWKEDELVKQ